MPYRGKVSRKSSRGWSSKKTMVKKARRSASKPTVRNMAVKQIVKREIARAVETKSKESLNYQQVLYPTYDTTNWPVYNVVPVGFTSSSLDIFQGTGEGQRIGNKIKVKKLTYKGTIVPAPFDATTNTKPRPQQLKVFFMYDKTAPTTKPNPLGDFFQFNNTSNAIANDLADLWAPINTEKYRVLKTKTFKLGYGQFTSGSGGSPADGYFCNNDFKLNCNFSFDLTKYIPQLVQYNDNNSDPTSRGLYAVWVLCSADGGPIAATQRTVGVQWWLRAEYEDA